MHGTVLAPGRLVCPNDCGAVAPNVARAQIGVGSTTMHPCKAFAGMAVPLVPEGTRAEARAVERGDFVGSEDVQRDAEGRVVMAVETWRDDGKDCTVYAPCARGELER